MSIKVIQISDCHLFADSFKSGYNQIAPYTSLDSVLTDMSTIEADLIVVSGDISGDHSQQSYHHFIELIERHNLLEKLVVLPGNHDQNRYFDHALSQWDITQSGPIRLGNWMLHGLDTRFEGNLGKHDERKLKQITQRIESCQELAHVLFCHHHPIDANSWMDKHEWVNRHQFMSQIDSLKQLKLVIYGHIHTDSRIPISHTMFESCPSTCWQWEMSEQFALSEDAPGYKVFELMDNLSFQSCTFRTI